MSKDTLISIDALGITKEDLAVRVVDRIAEQMLSHLYSDPDGDETDEPTEFRRVIEKRVTARIDEAVDQIAAKNVLPNIAEYIENLCLQQTNKWGEAKGKKLTFIEYLIERAEAYLTEKVSYDGKAKGEDHFSWTGTQTRVTYLVNKHLQYSIETAMKAALKDANSAIVEGLEETIKIKLNEVRKKLKVTVKT